MRHLDEAAIQTFLDGEMSDSEIALATKHLAVCGRCAQALTNAEAEQAEINLAFIAEASAPCPSQRIWARIENEIDFLAAPPECNSVKAQTKSFWQQLGTLWTPAQIGFAGGLAAVVLVSFFAIQVLRQNSLIEDQPVAQNLEPQVKNTDSPKPTVTLNPDGADLAKLESPAAPTRVVKISNRPKINKPALINPKPKTQSPKSLSVLPEEQNYLNSIAELSKAVEANDEFVMRPGFRVDYERNLAVTDGAISAMQKQVRQNPKDENAKRILFASYQNKIELLNTVAEKSQMIASLR